MNVLCSSNSFHQIHAPGFETIDPAFHRVVISAKLLDGKLRAPAIVLKRLHRSRLDLLLILPVQDLTADLVVTVGEHISFNNDRIPADALDRTPPATDF